MKSYNDLYILWGFALSPPEWGGSNFTQDRGIMTPQVVPRFIAGVLNNHGSVRSFGSLSTCYSVCYSVQVFKGCWSSQFKWNEGGGVWPWPLDGYETWTPCRKFERIILGAFKSLSWRLFLAWSSFAQSQTPPPLISPSSWVPAHSNTPWTLQMWKCAPKLPTKPLLFFFFKFKRDFKNDSSMT